MHFADTSSPGRMWTLAREAGDAGWNVRAERDGLNRAEWLLRLTHHGTAAYADARWTFWHKTHPGSAGTWRIRTVHAVLDGQEHECKLIDLADLIAHPPVPGRSADTLAATLGETALDALTATAAGQVTWDSRDQAQPDSIFANHTRTWLPALTMPRLVLLGLATAGDVQEHPPTRVGQSAPWQSRTYAITGLGLRVLEAGNQ
ncbi:hypothetical protein JNW90_00785 [Micromonospora sp. STR1s_5]|nr:hypothetical protein [Micromonospora sp. STR1s_5]